MNPQISVKLAKSYPVTHVISISLNPKYSGSDAQCEVSTGVGTLAGSTIMLLTIPWAGSLFLGARDRDPETGEAACKENGRPKYEDGFQLCSSCVTTYENTVMGAKLMMATAACYLIVLTPAIIYMDSSSSYQIKMEHVPALVGLIGTMSRFIFITTSIYMSSVISAHVPHSSVFM